MFLSGYIIVFVIGLGFGFLLGARMILRGIDQPGEHLYICIPHLHYADI